MSHIFKIRVPPGFFLFFTFFEVSTYIAEIPEGDELDDIADGLLPGVGPQNAGVSIQKLHGGEVGVADADDDDGHRQLGRLNDGVASLIHVANDAVRDDEESEVLLQKERKADVKQKKKTIESFSFHFTARFKLSRVALFV